MNVLAKSVSSIGAARKSDHQRRVEQFMVLAGQEVPSKPIAPVAEIRELRAKLILEEALETIEALGCEVTVGDENKVIVLSEKCDYVVKAAKTPDLVEIVDGCCDIMVVTTGTLSACGVPDRHFQHEVDRNNLDKFGPGGHRREDGKWVKPPGHRPPRIQWMLEEL